MRHHGHSEREDTDARPERRTSRPLEQPNHPRSTSGLLSLQASAGNGAVADLLRPPTSARGDITIQRATVSGVRNDAKTATDIGNDVHALVQNAFLDSDLADEYDLDVEVQAGPGRADLVAIKDERDEDGLGDMWIYVGEIKSESDHYYAGGRTYHQLSAYLDAYRQQYPHAHVGALTFWNTDADGYPLHGNGYDCVVYVANADGGLYRYSGRSTPEGQSNQSDRIEAEGSHPLPFNEASNATFA